MSIWFVIHQLLSLYFFLIIVRVVVETVAMLARDWRPRGIVAIILEVIFTITDPVLKFARKIIPTVRVGGVVTLDFSVMVVLIVLSFLVSLLGHQV